MSLPTLSNELPLLIAHWLPTPDLSCFLIANRHLAALLTPLLHHRIIAPHLYTHVDPDDIFTEANQLHWAADSSYEHLIRLLLWKGFFVDVLDCLGNTPLQYAADSGNEAVCHLLLENDADVNTTNSKGYTPLISAINSTWCSSEPIVGLLLDSGASIEDDSSVFHVAAMRGKTEAAAVIKLLLEWGADIGALDEYEETALHIAAESNYIHIAQLLLDNGADINAGPIKPIIKALRKDRNMMLEFLLEKGADPNAQDAEGHTPLYFAMTWGKLDAVRLLTDFKADLAAR